MHGEGRSPSLTSLGLPVPIYMGKWWERNQFGNIMGVMAQQKPPKSEGLLSGFPYSTLWEEFAEIWHSLGDRAETVGTYEILLGQRDAMTRLGATYPTAAAIMDLVQRLDLAPAKAKALSDRLYRIAAAFCLPRLRKELGIDPIAVRKRLTTLSRTAGEAAAQLQHVSVDQEIVLGLIRGLVVDRKATPLFDFKVLVRELRDLSASAQVCASEIPRMGRGTSISVMRARLMEAATAAIGEASSIEIEVRQADSAGRNPRAGSKSAEFLFKYLNLVDPGMTEATKVRLFLEFNRAWRSLTSQEMRAEASPRRLHPRGAREKLMK